MTTAIQNFRTRPKEIVNWRNGGSLYALDRANSALGSLDPTCARERWVSIAMAAKAAGLSFEDFHLWSKPGRNYQNERDCERVWKSIDPVGGITESTLFSYAQQMGWRDNSPDSGSLRSEKIAGPKLPKRRQLLMPDHRGRAVTEIWAEGEPATDIYPYIVKKGGSGDGLRIYAETAPLLKIAGKNMAGWLMVPSWDLEGELQTIQFISPDGEKLNLPKASYENSFLALGDFAHAQELVLVEGIGQAWAVRKATNHVAIICFGAGRIRKVADALRQQHPKSRLILVPDRGKEAVAADIARAINGEWCELPADRENNFDVNDLMQEGGIPAVQALLSSSHPTEPRFPLVSASKLKAMPAMEWLVQGVFPAQGLAAIYGPSGAGKSFLALDLAAAIAAGKKEWFGLQIRQAGVTYIGLEGVQGLLKRTEAWGERHGTLPDALHFMIKPINLLSDADLIELAKSIKAYSINNGLIIIDTLNRAAPNADENASADMGRIISAASKLQALVGGLVLLIHHSGKDADKGMRGHSSLHAALDTILEVAYSRQQRSWKVKKCKDGEDGRQFFFRLESAPVEVGEQGAAETSCTVIAGERSTEKRHVSASAPKQPLGQNQKVAKQLIDEMLAASSEIGKGGAPGESPCVIHSDAVSKVEGQLTCSDRHRKLRAREAIDALITQGLYSTKDEWLWRI